MHVQPPRVRNKNLTKTLPYCHVARLGANKVPFAKGTLFVVVPHPRATVSCKLVPVPLIHQDTSLAVPSLTLGVVHVEIASTHSGILIISTKCGDLVCVQVIAAFVTQEPNLLIMEVV